MTHELYDSVEMMLMPETLSKITGKPVKHVRCQPMSSCGIPGASGAQLLSVAVDMEGTTSHYVLKLMSMANDWLMQASEDRYCRSVSLWQSGLLDRLRPSVDHGIIAGATDDNIWAILMRDVSESLIPPSPYTLAAAKHFLNTLAIIHATFWDQNELPDPSIGLSDITGMIQTLSLETARRLLSSSSSIPAVTIEGWALLQEMVGSEVADLLMDLGADPQPLHNALASYPNTLLHGDFKLGNLGVTQGSRPQTIVLDWQVAGYGAATIDLAWFLGWSVYCSPLSTEAATAFYRQSLERQVSICFDDKDWQRLLELGTLTNILRAGSSMAWWATHEENEEWRTAFRILVDQYTAQARAASRWL